MKKLLIILIGVFIIFIYVVNFMLLINKTYYKTTYHTLNGTDIFKKMLSKSDNSPHSFISTILGIFFTILYFAIICLFSYFDSECCMTAATFYSLKSKNLLDEEISNYLKDFTYFNNGNTYGYINDDVFLQSYEVIDLGLYRKIVIVY